MTFESGWAYTVLTPLQAASGVALLGDTDKISPMGRARISVAAEHGAETHATVRFAAGEGPRTIAGYAAATPKIKAVKGAVSNMHYDDASHVFSVLVSPADDNQSVLYLEAAKK